MNRLTKIASVAAALAFSAAAYASSPGVMGWTEPGSVSCFTRSGAPGSGAGVRNQCTSSQTWVIPFHVPSSGTKTVSVLASRPSSSVNVCCSATSIDTNGNLYGSLTSKCLPASSLQARISVGNIGVPSYGTLIATCSVGAGASVISATY